MKTPEQIAADEAAAAAEAALVPAESFRTLIEKALEGHHDRLTILEATGGAGVDEEGSSLAGKVRTFESRILAVEEIQSTNTANILRLSELVQTQLAGAAARIAILEGQVKALQPAP